MLIIVVSASVALIIIGPVCLIIISPVCRVILLIVVSLQNKKYQKEGGFKTKSKFRDCERDTQLHSQGNIKAASSLVTLTCIIIVLGIICIIVSVGTPVCSVIIFRIALPVGESKTNPQISRSRTRHVKFIVGTK